MSGTDTDTDNKYKYPTSESVDNAINNPNAVNISSVKETLNTVAATAAEGAKTATLTAAANVGEAATNLTNSIDLNLPSLQDQLDNLERRVGALEKSSVPAPTIDPDKQSTTKTDEIKDVQLNKAQVAKDTKCPSEYTKFGNDAHIDTVVNAGVDALVITLSSDTKFDTMLDFMFNYAERVLYKCRVFKQNVGIDIFTNTQLPERIKQKIALDVASITPLLANTYQINQIIEKLKCLKNKDIKTKYDDFKNNLTSNLEKAKDKVLSEIKSYLKTGILSIGFGAIQNMIEAHMASIIQVAVKNSNAVFTIIDPIIDKLDSKQELNIEDIKSIIEKKLPKSGGRKTHKKGYKKRRITKRKCKSKTHKRRIMKKRNTKKRI
jgi:hypothetical protein